MVRYLNGGQKTGLKKLVHGPKCQVLEWSAKSCDLPFEYQTVSGIQMVTVVCPAQYFKIEKVERDMDF